MQSKLCLVLGANGFIGSHLVDELISTGYNIRAFDRFQEPTRQPNFNANDKIEIVAGDIYDPQMLANSLESVDYVFHCFSATTPHSSDNDPITDIEKNLKPSIKIFENCVEAGVKKVIFISSGGAIYGHLAEEKPALETDAATPVSPYGIVKLAIENYLAYFNRKFDLDFIIYRLTNPYGPRQKFRNNQGVIPAFLGNIKNKQPIEVLGDGQTSRDYIYIKDAVKMIINSFDNSPMYKTYNIGSGKQTTLNEIIEVLQGLFDQKIEVKYKKEPKTFLRSAKISNARFIKEFDYSAFTPLSKGIETMLKHSHDN